MKTIFFDTETTGFNPGNICQLSYVMIDDRNIRGKNFYFKVGYIESGAQAVHGLTVKILERLSNNKAFSHFATEIKNDFEEADNLVAHNFSFDRRFLAAEFDRCRMNIKFNGAFCTMNYFTSICKLKGRRSGYKYPRLEELIDFFKINRNDISKTSEKLFDEGSIFFHDARFDTAATYMCCKKAVEKQMIDERYTIL